MRGIPSDPTNNSTLLLEDFGGFLGNLPTVSQTATALIEMLSVVRPRYGCVSWET